MPTAPGGSTNGAFGVDAGERADMPSDAPVPRKRIRTKRHGRRKKEALAMSTAAEVSTSALPLFIGTVTPTPSASTPGVSWLAPECSTSNGLVDGTTENADMDRASELPRKRPKRRGGERARSRRDKRRKALQATPKPPVTYHVRNGQIVTLASEPEPESQAPATPSASQPEEDARTPTRMRHREGQENRAMKTPLSSPGAKEDAWSVISKRGGTWPEPPSTFSHWDVQVCFCF